MIRNRPEDLVKHKSKVFFLSVKVKLFLFLTKHHAMGEWRYSSTHSLTSALDGGE
jgi:hypothetical protein